MGNETSLKTTQRRGCNPLNPPPGSASDCVFFPLVDNLSVGLHTTQTTHPFLFRISLAVQISSLLNVSTHSFSKTFLHVT